MGSVLKFQKIYILESKDVFKTWMTDFKNIWNGYELRKQRKPVKLVLT